MHYTEYFTLRDCSGFLQIRSHLTVTLKKGDVKRTVHINRVRPLQTEDLGSNGPKTGSTPPLFHHYEITESNSPDDHFSAHNSTSDDKAP